MKKITWSQGGWGINEKEELLTKKHVRKGGGKEPPTGLGLQRRYRGPTAIDMRSQHKMKSLDGRTAHGAKF